MVPIAGGANNGVLGRLRKLMELQTEDAGGHSFPEILQRKVRLYYNSEGGGCTPRIYIITVRGRVPPYLYYNSERGVYSALIIFVLFHMMSFCRTVKDLGSRFD